MVAVLGDAVLFAASVAALWVGARSLVAAAGRLARRAGVPELVVGLTVVAVGTSLPELVVTADAALAGAGDVAVGNVLGSNVYNLAAILGVVALVAPVGVDRSLLRSGAAWLLGSTLLVAGLLVDLRLSRLDAAVLLAGFLAYQAVLLAGWPPWNGDGDAAGSEAGPDGSADSDSGQEGSAGGDGRREGDAGRPARDAAVLVAGLAVVLVGGHFLVVAATGLARGVGVSEWVIGATVVAAGTSTPEFAVSVVALRGGRVGVSVGNVVGSNVFNALGVLGLGGLLAPLGVAPAALETAAWLVVLVALVVAALLTGRRLTRPEGGLLVASEVVRWVLALG